MIGERDPAGPQRPESGPIGAALVVGGGIGGMQASLDLANAGIHVTLVEQESSIGGRMAQLDKTFPTNDCSMCTISPKLIEVDKHRGIEVLTNAQVLGLEGQPGDFRAEVELRPRFVDLSRCNGCGDCLEVCPVDLFSEFDGGTARRKAIGRRYPQAIPGAMAIAKTARPPCVRACPAGVNCQGYTALVAAGRFEEAYALIRERNPFPAACGRVCHHPCEAECNRGELDQPVNINGLKRFAADWVHARRAAGEPVAPAPVGQVDADRAPVAVVGGGPSGLTAARELALRGYPVTLLEAGPELGGALLTGVPDYRLPRQALERDLADVLASGFAVETDRALGRDFQLGDLRTRGFEAVYLALGCGRSAPLVDPLSGSPVPGAELEGVVCALEWLGEVNSRRAPELSGRVVVIGGGDVAVDAAMTAVRRGAREVQLVCLESRAEMPAHEWELGAALEEGISLKPGWGPRTLRGANGQVRALELVKCISVFDERGRFAPSFDEVQTISIAADLVIVAIGQGPELSWMSAAEGLGAAGGRSLPVDPLTLQTGLDWVFAGGDLCSGPASVVDAIAQGHAAAESIDRYLSGADLRAGREPVERDAAPLPDGAFPEVRRAEAPRLSAGERRDFREIEATLSEEAALREAQRCLACGLCSECGRCVEACGADAIRHDMLPERRELEVGAVLLAPGFAPIETSVCEEYGHGRHANVVTALEFERILSASGPTGGEVRRPSDGAPPRRVAWIQCVGSRDLRGGAEYCSGVCCMASVKEAVMAVDHVPGLEATIFHNDVRAHGKGFEAYAVAARERHGVRFERSLISSIKERRRSGNLVLTTVDAAGGALEREFDLVVLAVGLRASPGTAHLAERLGVELDPHGFCSTRELSPGETSRPGVFAAGTFTGPMDIPETVMAASGAAARVGELLAGARGTRIPEKRYPPERDVGGAEPRVGVFVCRCGTNIARTVEVSEVVVAARALPGVVFAEENLYTCSTDTQALLTRTIREHDLNRVVVASCTPRTHEALFQETLREAGLNKHLFEMANIRDQCSWVHAGQPAAATHKAVDLVRQAVGRVRTLLPFAEVRVAVDQRALVLGGGAAGMSAALSLADQGFGVSLVEREGELGGIARRLHRCLDGLEPRSLVADLAGRIRGHGRIELFLGETVEQLCGHLGSFRARLSGGAEVGAGAVVVATGGQPHEPDEYGYGRHPAILTQLELEARLAEPDFAQGLDRVVMIQCVGSRSDEHRYCSRICCRQAVENALALKRARPGISVHVLFRDLRTYGLFELAYRRAREAGVVFLGFDPEAPPAVTANGRLRVRLDDDVLGRPLELEPDLVVLSVGVRPGRDAGAVSRALKVPLDADGFFLEAHMKLRPLDFASEGIFLAGLAHGPKTLGESIRQALGAAARAATVLSEPFLERSGIVSEVDRDSCAACLTCVRSCPYGVPRIDEQGLATIEPASCQGCGVCAAACPRKAIATRHYRDEQLASGVAALLGANVRTSVPAACPHPDGGRP